MDYTTHAGQPTTGVVWSPGPMPGTVWVLPHTGASSTEAVVVHVAKRAQVAPSKVASVTETGYVDQEHRRADYRSRFKHAPRLTAKAWREALGYDPRAVVAEQEALALDLDPASDAPEQPEQPEPAPDQTPDQTGQEATHVQHPMPTPTSATSASPTPARRADPMGHPRHHSRRRRHAPLVSQHRRLTQRRDRGVAPARHNRAVLVASTPAVPLPSGGRRDGSHPLVRGPQNRAVPCPARRARPGDRPGCAMAAVVGDPLPHVWRVAGGGPRRAAGDPRHAVRGHYPEVGSPSCGVDGPRHASTIRKSLARDQRDTVDGRHPEVRGPRWTAGGSHPETGSPRPATRGGHSETGGPTRAAHGRRGPPRGHHPETRGVRGRSGSC